MQRPHFVYERSSPAASLNDDDRCGALRACMGPARPSMTHSRLTLLPYWGSLSTVWSGQRHPSWAFRGRAGGSDTGAGASIWFLAPASGTMYRLLDAR